MAVAKIQNSKFKIQNYFFILLLILTIASFFRLWHLESIPPGLYPDEAINGNEAISNPGKIFYPENNGREGLFINLLALSFSIFGISIWSLKIVPAIIGILTVLGLYLLTKELFNQILGPENIQLKVLDSEGIALLSSFFLAISFWHVNFSRISFRAILLPFILVFSFYFLFKSLNYLIKIKQTNTPMYRCIFLFSLAGIFFGLGFYTYTSFRMAVLILPFVLIPYWFILKKQNLQRKYLFLVSLFLIFIFLVALPLGIYFLQNPEYFLSRAASVLIFAAENPLKELGKSLILHLGMFNFYGDPNWRHNFSGSAMLFWPIGILFLIGFFYSLFKLAKSILLGKMELFVVFGFLISWWLIMLFPGILTYEGIPHALRTIGVIPVVYIFGGLGSWEIYQWLAKNTKHQKLLLATVLIFLLMILAVEFDKYFNKWGKNPEVKNAFSADYVEIGNYLNSLPPETLKYVIVNVPGVPVPYPDGIPMPAQTIMFIESTKYGQPQATYLLPEDLDKIKIKEKAIVVKMRYE